MHSLVPRGIGLFGGTFDPVHTGHLAVAHKALQALALARLDFVLAANPWQKKVVTSCKAREEMLRLAIAHEPRFAVNLTEVLRGGASYTIDTLETMRELVGPAMPLVLILGQDQWTNFHTWKNWERFCDLAHIAICNRGNASEPAREDVQEWAAGKCRKLCGSFEDPAGSIVEFRINPIMASSTAIRCTLATQPRPQALRKLETVLPVAVASYLARTHLY